MITAQRYHDISCGHRVVGHEGKCVHLHGHNYRVHFVCKQVGSTLDIIGRVLDFSVIKEKLCMWLENNWDHRMLIWSEDPMLHTLQLIDSSVVMVPFNPTAENMAAYLIDEIAPEQLRGTGCECIKCVVEETRKCSATAQKTI